MTKDVQFLIVVSLGELQEGKRGKMNDRKLPFMQMEMLSFKQQGCDTKLSQCYFVITNFATSVVVSKAESNASVTILCPIRWWS